MVATIARRARFFLLCVLIVGAAAAISWYRERHAAASITGRVRVIDGDSLTVDGVEVRLFGIDAPEYYQTCTRENGPWNCGIDAAQGARCPARHATAIATAALSRSAGRASSTSAPP